MTTTTTKKWCWADRFDRVHSVADRDGTMVADKLRLHEARQLAIDLARQNQQLYFYGPTSEAFDEYSTVAPTDAEVVGR